MRSLLSSIVFLGLAFTGCDSYEPRNQPWPEEMELRMIDGPILRSGDLEGRPWVINVWRPG
jgi:hypothetical protein